MTHQPGRLGSLTYEQALSMHDVGCTRDEIAKRAGVRPRTVTTWRKAHGLVRRYEPTGLSTDDMRAYKREWKRRKGAA